MGTEKTRQLKLEWMTKIRKQLKKPLCDDENFLIRQCMKTFSCSKVTAREVFWTVKEEAQLKL